MPGRHHRSLGAGGASERKQEIWGASVRRVEACYALGIDERYVCSAHSPVVCTPAAIDLTYDTLVYLVSWQEDLRWRARTSQLPMQRSDHSPPEAIDYT